MILLAIAHVRYWVLGSLSSHVFERRPSNGSKAFCLDANKFVLVSFFSLITTIYPRVSTKPLPNDAKSPPPVDVRRSNTLFRKLPIKILTWLRGFRDRMANFSRLHCLQIPRRDLNTKKTEPNMEKWLGSLGVMLEFNMLYVNVGYCSIVSILTVYTAGHQIP